MIDSKWAFCICDFETTGIHKEALPIEVGCIWTDSNFRTLKTYEALTQWPEIKKTDWYSPLHMGAYNVHKIQWEEYIKEGIRVEEAAVRISQINHILRDKYDRVILISDNAKFETNHMEKMYDEANILWDFHYTTWDTSLMLEAVGVGDPIPAHRAFDDASLLQVAIIKAMDRIRNLK